MVNTKYNSIKELVFTYIHQKDGMVEYKKLADLVIRYFPDSKWNQQHWSWYRSRIKNGRFGNEFSKAERSNLFCAKLGHGQRLIEGKTMNTLLPPKSKKQTVHKPTIIKKVFPNKLKEEQRIVALSLARVCHHIHPKIVRKICIANKDDRSYLLKVVPKEVRIKDYLYAGSACLFPGVRRFVGKLDKSELLKYVSSKKAIIDDNRMPRNLWSFLTAGRGYSGAIWKQTGLDEYELAHIFSHKQQRNLEKCVFKDFDSSIRPYGLFSCASNVVLIPKGLAKPTDSLDAILVAFFKRHIELYGEEVLPGIRGFKNAAIPEWYNDLVWNEPILPKNWEENVNKLLKYRGKRLEGLFSKPI